MQKHVEYTGSTLAQSMLSDWANASKKFVKVMLSDFKRVLKQQEEARKNAPAAAGE